MRIYPSPVLDLLELRSRHRHAGVGNVFADARFLPHAHFLHTAVLLMPSRLQRLSSTVMLQHCCAVMAKEKKAGPALSQPIGCAARISDSHAPPTGLKVPM